MHIEPNYIGIAFDAKSIFLALMFLLAILGYVLLKVAYKNNIECILNLTIR